MAGRKGRNFFFDGLTKPVPLWWTAEVAANWNGALIEG